MFELFGSVFITIIAEHSNQSPVPSSNSSTISTEDDIRSKIDQNFLLQRAADLVRYYKKFSGNYGKLSF